MASPTIDKGQGAAQICLASISPRRRELLSQIGVRFFCVDPDVDEASIRAPDPKARIVAVARAKANSGAVQHSQCPVLAADTAVVCDDLELGKPRNRDHAVEMLHRLSGRSHWVYTAVVIQHGDDRFEDVGATQVWFRPLRHREIESYCESDEPFDKAGAYGIQGYAAVFISRIEGSYSTVVGLPLFETAALLEKAGVEL